MAQVRLDPPYEHIVVSFPTVVEGTEKPLVEFYNEETNTRETWSGPYAEALGKTLLTLTGEDESPKPSE